MPGLTQAPGGESTTLETQDAFLLQRNGTDFWAERQNVLAFPQDWVVSRPVGKEEQILSLANFGSKAQMVTEAITYAKDNGGGHIVVSRNLPPWDVSSVTHALSVQHYMSGQEDHDAYNVRAYGAVGDNSNDDHPAFQKAHDQAKAASGDGKNIRLVVPASDEAYRLQSQWLLTASSLSVIGGGKFNCQLVTGSNFDSTTYEALVALGDGSSATSSFTFEGFHVIGGGSGKEVSGIKTNFFFSGTIRNCKLKAGGLDDENLGRETACLHIFSGKNLYVESNEISTTSSYGILVDNRGTSNSLNGALSITDNQITEHPCNIYIKTGFPVVKIQDNVIGATGSNNTPVDNHNIVIDEYRACKIQDNQIRASKYGVLDREGNECLIEGNFFTRIDRQSIIYNGNRFTRKAYTDNLFKFCGIEHIEGGSIAEDYTTTDHVADIHVIRAEQGVSLLANNHHRNGDILTDAEARDKYSAILNAGNVRSSLLSGPNIQCIIANNASLPSGYRAINGDEVCRGQKHVMGPNGARVNGRMKGTYTGDGTTGRAITLGFRPNKVFVEDSSGTLYETRDDGLSPIDGTTPTGALTIIDDGFEVGDDGSDADPNTDTESYSYVAVE